MSRRPSLKRQKRIGDALAYLVVFVFLGFFLFPIFWSAITSIKLTKNIFELSFIPYLHFQPTGDYWYGELVSGFAETSRVLTNSVIIGISSSAIATFLGLMAGYALARFEYQKWKNIDIITWFLSLRILPPIALALPFYALMRGFNLLDNVLAVILVHSAFFMPYAVLISRDAFRALPLEIEEAALVDGCSKVDVFRRIALPLSAPTIVAIFILIFAFSWNDFLFPFVLTSKYAMPITVHIAGTVTTVGVIFQTLAIRMLLAIIPPVVLSLFVQRYIVSGLTLGAVKGAR